MLYACLYQHQPPPPLIKERRRKKSDATQPLPPAVAVSPRLSRARRTQTGQHATKTKTKTKTKRRHRGSDCISGSNPITPPQRPVRGRVPPYPFLVRVPTEPSQPWPCVRVVWCGSPRAAASACGPWLPSRSRELMLGGEGRRRWRRTRTPEATEIVRGGEPGTIRTGRAAGPAVHRTTAGHRTTTTW